MRIKLFIVFILLSFLASCSIKLVVVDKSVPVEKAATVYFNGVSVIKYNGNSVEKGHALQILAGNTEITCDVLHGTVSSQYRAKNKRFSFKFEEGKRYLASFGIESGYWGVFIYENPKKLMQGGLDEKSTFVGFAKRSGK